MTRLGHSHCSQSVFGLHILSLMKINEINRVHLSAGNRGEAALRVIQSAHSEAQTETDEPERRMKVRTEKFERKGEMEETRQLTKVGGARNRWRQNEWRKRDRG